MMEEKNNAFGILSQNDLCRAVISAIQSISIEMRGVIKDDPHNIYIIDLYNEVNHRLSGVAIKLLRQAHGHEEIKEISEYVLLILEKAGVNWEHGSWKTRKIGTGGK